MEPVTATLISGVVSYLVKQLGKQDSIKEFGKEFTSLAVDWIKPIFIVDDEITDDAKDAIEDPDKTNISALEIQVSKLLKKNPSYIKNLKIIASEIEAESGKPISKISIKGDRNILLSNSNNNTINSGDNNNAEK